MTLTRHEMGLCTAAPLSSQGIWACHPGGSTAARSAQFRTRILTVQGRHLSVALPPRSQTNRTGVRQSDPARLPNVHSRLGQPSEHRSVLKGEAYRIKIRQTSSGTAKWFRLLRRPGDLGRTEDRNEVRRGDPTRPPNPLFNFCQSSRYHPALNARACRVKVRRTSSEELQSRNTQLRTRAFRVGALPGLT